MRCSFLLTTQSAAVRMEEKTKRLSCSRDKGRHEAHHDRSMFVSVIGENAVSRRDDRVHKVKFQLILAKVENFLSSRFVRRGSGRMCF